MEHEVPSPVVRILLIDEDDASYHFHCCMARVLSELPPVEVFHAHDASEALGMLDKVSPDVLLLSHDSKEEKTLLLELLKGNHPPVVVSSDDAPMSLTLAKRAQVTMLPACETLEDIKNVLTLATSLGLGGTKVKETTTAIH